MSVGSIPTIFAVIITVIFFSVSIGGRRSVAAHEPLDASLPPSHSIGQYLQITFELKENLGSTAAPV